MAPPRARTWGRAGRRPVVRVRSRGSGRQSMVGMCCFKPGPRSKLFYGLREYRDRKGEPKGFGWRDFCRLLVRARIQLGDRIMLVRDNVRLLTRGMRELIDRNSEWLTVFRLPTCAHRGAQPASVSAAGGGAGRAAECPSARGAPAPSGP